MARFTRDQFNEIMRRPGYTPLDAGVRHAEPQPAPREESLDIDPSQESRPSGTCVVITRYSTGRLDKDNLYGSGKQVLDALRYAGWIRDDDPDSIQLVVRQRKVKKADQGTEVLIIRP